ncbi:MAG TPA: metallophosphoesterase family protein [Microthrixaceae bacterium]|nr:metallophosphoesterase family protein [Microthrixaceae bacterium]
MTGPDPADQGPNSTAPDPAGPNSTGPADPAQLADPAEHADPAQHDGASNVRESRFSRLSAALSGSRIAFTIWVVAVTLILVPLVFRSEAKLGPGTFSASISPAMRGTTQLGVPPLGSLSANTHSAPVRLNFELREVDLLDAIDPLNKPGIEGIEAEVRDDLGQALVHMALVLGGVSILVGLGAAAVFPGRRSIGRLGAGALIAPLVVTALVAPAAWGFDAEKLEKSPELNGPLGSAQTLFAKVGSLDTRFGSVSSRTEVLAAKITGLYSAATTSEISRSDGEVALLHVSDLHLNSVGLALARDLANRFGVDAVIDTGDITSFGFEPEATFVETLDGFSMPYYLVAGNHDSEGVRRQLAQSDAVTYLDGETAQVGDVKILGIGDPTVTALRTIPKDRLDRTYRAQFKSTEELVRREKPDLLMVHNPVQLKPVLGKVPAAAAGHLHQTKLEVIDGTVVAIVGSSGATGLGDLLVEADAPYRFEILRFQNGELVAVDEITLNGAAGDFTLQRRLIETEAADTADQLPDSGPGEPSLEQMEAENPEALDAVTSTTTSSSTPPNTSTRTGSSTTGSTSTGSTTTTSKTTDRTDDPGGP